MFDDLKAAIARIEARGPELLNSSEQDQFIANDLILVCKAAAAYIAANTPPDPAPAA